MAICRWSSDDFACDFYIYQDASFGGITMWIAGNHSNIDRDSLPGWPTWDAEKFPFETLDAESPEWKEYCRQWMAHKDALRAMLDSCEREVIDHEYAGGHFRFETPDEVVEFLEKEIIPTGKFNVPEWLIPDLKEWELIQDGPED